MNLINKISRSIVHAPFWLNSLSLGMGIVLVNPLIKLMESFFQTDNFVLSILVGIIVISCPFYITALVYENMFTPIVSSQQNKVLLANKIKVLVTPLVWFLILEMFTYIDEIISGFVYAWQNL